MARPGLRNHPKFRRLVATLGEPRPHVVGYLESIWEVCYEAGNPLLGDDVDVILAAEYPHQDRAGAFVQALATCGGTRAGFIEQGNAGQWQVHDLFDHAPEYVLNRSDRELERKKDKLCANCGRGYRSTEKHSKYCCDKCRQMAWRNGHNGARNDDALLVTSRNEPPAPAQAPAPAPSHTSAGASERPLDSFSEILAKLDWPAVGRMASAVAAKVPPKKSSDRRALLRFAVLAQTSFSEAWLSDGVAAALARKSRGEKVGHLHGALRNIALEKNGIDRESFRDLLKRIEIPDEVWQSSLLRKESDDSDQS